MTRGQKKYKALVLGVDDRAALTVIRSLGRKGIEVHQGSDVPFSYCQLSKYTSKVLAFPDAGKEPQAWLAALEDYLQQDRYDLVIPTADNYLVPCVQEAARLAPLSRFAIPDERGFTYTYSKSKTFELAASLGVPLPRTEEISNGGEIDRIEAEFGLPVIVKPVSSKVWQENVRHNLTVQLARDRSELAQLLDRLLPICPVLIQSVHSGVGVGQEFLMKDGALVAAFQHERVHEPQKGGGSSYRKSAPLDQGLLEHSVNMLAALNWTGVAMVEYKYDDRTAESVLMEINGRFWGSLPLAVAAGVDFPGLLFDMMVLDKIPDTPPTYRSNVYCRNPVKDLDWLKENIRADHRDPYALTVPHLKVAAEVVHLLTFREYSDTLVLDDPRPGVRQLGDYLGSNFRGAREKLQRVMLNLNYRFNPLSVKLPRKRLRRLVANEARVAFVCKGNICRSPFAGIYLQERAREAHITHLHIDSFGLIKKENRRSPENAITAARLFDIDMDAHRSRVLTDQHVEESDIIFIMDIELYRRMRTEFPRSRAKLFFLGVLQNGRGESLEIIDPYGHEIDQFKHVYQQIVHSIDELLALVKE